MSDVFNVCVLLILTMICFCFLMARMTGAGWCYRSGTLSTYCSVMRLSCLDELLNNDIFLSLSLRDMFSKGGPVFWWNLWHMKVDVFFCFCLSLEEMTTSLFLDGIL